MAALASQTEPSPAGVQPCGRIALFDLVRGISILSMVGFHLCYDLKFIEGLPLDWFAPPLQDIWRASISWTFVFVAGCMFCLSRNNLRRGLVYGGVALAVWAVTAVASVDDAISFGIIYCMAACTLTTEGLRRLRALPKGHVAASVLLIAFLCLLGLQNGSIFFGSAEVPGALYSTECFSWLGFPGPAFVSGDYYPLLPYLLLYLAGVSAGTVWKEKGFLDWAKRARLAPLNFVGRHTLAVYVIHQPIILGLLMLLGR